MIDWDYTGEQAHSYDFAVQRAAELGVDIELSNPYTLQLDLDSPEALKTFQYQIQLLQDLDLLPFTGGYEERPSRNGNTHVTVDLLRPLLVHERILLQALLGSDLKREALSYAGALAGNPHPVLLFRPKEQLKAATGEEPKPAEDPRDELPF